MIRIKLATFLKLHDSPNMMIPKTETAAVPNADHIAYAMLTSIFFNASAKPNKQMMYSHIANNIMDKFDSSDAILINVVPHISMNIDIINTIQHLNDVSPAFN